MDALQQLDGNLLIGIQSALYADWLTPIMKFITIFGDNGIFWIAVCLVLMMFKKTRRLGIICSLSLLFTFICCNLTIKPIVDRTRPWVLFEEVNRLIADPGDSSFPSGHSADSMGPAWALFIATAAKKVRLPGSSESSANAKFEKSYDATPCLGWMGDGVEPKLMHKFGIAAVVLAVLIGISRLYLGVHFPTDVIAGLILGMICATIVHLIVIKIETKRGRIFGGDKVSQNSEV